MENPILEKLDSLECLKCQSNTWDIKKEFLECKKCGHHYPIEENHILTTDNYFKEDRWEYTNNAFEPLLSGKMAKSKLGGPRISELIEKLKIDGISINLGAGQDNYPGYINVDLGYYKPVHVIADLRFLPFADSSVSLVASNSVLEHIYDYNRVIHEVHRIMKKGGYFYLCVPSVCARHHQYDYHRWTSEGLKELLSGRFEIVEQGACRGVAYVLIPYVNYLLDYKIKSKFFLKMCQSIWKFVSLPLYWIKDEKNEQYQSLSQTIYILARKK